MAAQASAHDPDAQAAQRVLERLLSVKDSVALRVAAARVELRTGDRNLAISNLRHVLEVDPTNREAAELLRGMSP